MSALGRWGTARTLPILGILSAVLMMTFCARMVRKMGGGALCGHGRLRLSHPARLGVR